MLKSDKLLKSVNALEDIMALARNVTTNPTKDELMYKIMRIESISNNALKAMEQV